MRKYRRENLFEEGGNVNLLGLGLNNQRALAWCCGVGVGRFPRRSYGISWRTEGRKELRVPIVRPSSLHSMAQVPLPFINGSPQTERWGMLELELMDQKPGPQVFLSLCKKKSCFPTVRGSDSETPFLLYFFKFSCVNLNVSPLLLLKWSLPQLRKKKLLESESGSGSRNVLWWWWWFSSFELKLRFWFWFIVTCFLVSSSLPMREGICSPTTKWKGCGDSDPAKKQNA